MTVPRLLRRPEAALFALVFCCYAYFYQAGGWNQNSRFDLVRALVEQRSAVIDRYYRNTGDLSCRGPKGRCTRPRPRAGNHAYCDKAPGASWLAVPPYALVHAIWGGERPSRRYLAATSYLATVWAVGVPSALGVVMLFMLLQALGLATRAALAFSLAYGLATLAFPYATLFYGHQLMTALVVAGFALLVRARRTGRPLPAAGLVGVGLLLGYAVAVEYPAALAVAPVVVYAAGFVRPWRRLGWLALGMAVPALALAAYHWAVFGGPAALPYDFSTQGNRSQGFFMGLGAPSGEVLWRILFSAYRGLFYGAPWLLLAVPGGLLLWRRRRIPELAVVAAVVLLYLWLNASLVDWEGGWTMGPRYLIPAIPFLAIAAAGLAVPGKWGQESFPSVRGAESERAGEMTPDPISRAWRIGAWLVGGGVAAYSGFLMLVGTAVKPEVDVHVLRPFTGYLLPRFYGGQLAVNSQSIDSIAPARDGSPAAWNLGQLIGLDGLASLLPLALLCAAAAAWLWWTVKRSPEPAG